jgi:hypothetical protein
MLVAAAAISDTALVASECPREKARLAQQPLRAAVELSRVRVQRVFEERFEPIDLLRLPSQVVVEPQHLRHEAGADTKRQVANSVRRLAS